MYTRASVTILPEANSDRVKYLGNPRCFDIWITLSLNINVALKAIEIV